MQIPKYEQQNTINAQPTVRVQPVGDANAFGANVAQAEANQGNDLINMGKQFQQQVNEQQLKLNHEKVFSAYNGYMNEMTALQNDYLNKQGLEARGSTANATTAFADINKKYVEGLDNNAQRLAFSQMIDDIHRNAQNSIAKHENQQIEIGTEKSGMATVDNGVNRAAANPLNQDMLVSERKNAYAIYDSLYLGKYGKDYTDGMKRGYNDKVITGSIGTLLNQDNPDFENASKILEANKGEISTDTYDKLKPIIHAGQAKSETFQFKQSIKNNPEYHVDGDLSKPLDIVKLNQYIEQKYGPGATKTTNVPGAGISFDGIQKAAEPYMNMKYQMGGTGDGGIDCSAFTQKVYAQNGVDLPRTADYQYKYFSDKGQIFTDKSQLKPGDIVFMKNTYDPVAAGQGPCVDNNGVTHVGIYVDGGKVLQAGSSGVKIVSMDAFSDYAGYAHPKSDSNTQQTVSAYDPAKYQEYTQAAQQVTQESKIQYSQRQENLHNQIAEHCRQNSNETIEQRKNYIDSLGLRGLEYDSALQLGLSQYGVQKNIEKQKEHEAIEEAENEIAKGNIKSGKDFEMRYAGRISFSKLKSISNSIDAFGKKNVDESLQEPPEMQIKGGEEAFNLGLARANFNKKNFNDDETGYQNAKVMIREKVTNMIKAERAKGNNVSAAEIAEWTQNQATEQVIVSKSTFGNDKKPLYTVPSGFDVRADGVYDSNGRKVVYDNDSKSWVLDGY